MKHLLPYTLPTWERYNADTLTLCHTVTEKQVEEEGETKTMYECETVYVGNNPTKGTIVEALIRERYSVSDELALERQKSSKKTQWNEYDSFCESCKEIADRVLSTFNASI